MGEITDKEFEEIRQTLCEGATMEQLAELIRHLTAALVATMDVLVDDAKEQINA